MKQQTFEEYLQERHAVTYIGTDDDMSDDYDMWLEKKGVDAIIEYAERWGDQLKRIYSNEVLSDIINKSHAVR